MLGIVASYPIPASAGVLSFLFEGAKKVVIDTTGSSANAQTMAILQATPSADPTARGGGDTTIVDESALLPDSGPLGTRADIEDSPATSDQISIYTVHRGDTLSAIARMFGVSVNTIIWANDLKGSIVEGQNLVILPISGVQYTIKAGDTVQKIAEKFKASAQEVAVFNGIALDEKLAEGDTIIIPDGELAAPPKSGAVPGRKPRVYGVGGPLIPGYYIRPISGGRKTQGIHGYNGVDLAASVGAPIYAAAGGTVIISRYGGYNGGYGNYVVIAHPNGTQTLYAHMITTAIQAGASVAQGQIIGYVGSTGRSTGPHLHFEIRGAANPF